MPAPTFNIQDLVTPVGRAPANPFGYPSLAQQNPVRPQLAQEGGLGITLPEDVRAGSIYQILRGQQPSPTPTPTPGTSAASIVPINPQSPSAPAVQKSIIPGPQRRDLYAA